MPVLAAATAVALAQNQPRDSAADSIDFSEKPFREDRVALPSPPVAENLIPFDAGPARRAFTYAVDTASVTVGADGVVRYTLVARSDAGATNVTYEGIRCNTRERRVYAFARADGKWIDKHATGWAKIGAPAREGHVYVLYADFFCPARSIIRDTAEGIAALKRGRHPRASEEETDRVVPLGK
ncbi:MAG: CNP1-like family protein [Burkholderiales bacterium]|nr:CNP1-like family protein [Burkholderiales bacterium]